MSSNLVQYECKDCKSSWAACGASICYNCLSDNIFIFWKPGDKYIEKPKRIKLKIKKLKLRIKNG